MSLHYISKVKYKKLVDGKSKEVTEHYLFVSTNIADTYYRSIECLKTRIKNPHIKAVSESAYEEVIFYAGTADDKILADSFYQVIIDTNEKTTYLVPAIDCYQAIERALKAHGYGDASNVYEHKRTDILGIWDPSNELWQGDWWNRMEMLLQANVCSWDIKQKELFEDEDKTPKTPNNPGEGFEGLVVPFTMPQPTEADRIAAELNQRRTTTPALQNTAVGAGKEPVSVEAEDLENGYEPEPEQEIYHQATLMEAPKTGLLGSGTTEPGKPSRKRKPKEPA